MGEFLLAIGVVAVMFAMLFGIPYLAAEGMPEWVRLPRSKKKHRRQLLEYIEWRRAKDMKQFDAQYRSESGWNKTNLAHEVRWYERSPRARYQEMVNDRDETELMQWVLKNDPSVLKSRIQELEKELGLKSE